MIFCPFFLDLEQAVPLIGFEKTKEIDELIKIIDKPARFGPEEKKKAASISNELGGKFCRGCHYCHPCPQGISTALLMCFPRQFRQCGRKKLDYEEYAAAFDKFAECTRCRECEQRCPFSLPILDFIPLYRQQFHDLAENRKYHP